MKIIIVALDLGLGGTYTVLKNICPLLMKKHELTVLTNDDTQLNLDCHELIRLKLRSLPIPKYKFVIGLADFVRNNKLNDYDLIHIFEYPTFGADYLTLQKKKIKPPIIISAHGTLHQFSRFPLNIFKKIHNTLMLRYKDRISCFIASTEAEKTHLVKYGINHKKIKVLHLGVHPTSIKHIQNHRKNILYLGRLAVSKNVDLLIEAFALCNNKNLDLIIAGPDVGMLKKLKEQVSKLKLENRVFFKGKVSEEEKNNLMSKATIYVHPSLEDVFSLALIEAAAAGIPCIAFDVEANSEILDDMVSGKLVKRTNVSSLKEAIDMLVSDDRLLAKISQNAKEMIPKKFNWEKTVSTLENYYAEIINAEKN